jgi:hypothetical protein
VIGATGTTGVTGSTLTAGLTGFVFFVGLLCSTACAAPHVSAITRANTTARNGIDVLCAKRLEIICVERCPSMLPPRLPNACSIAHSKTPA